MYEGEGIEQDFLFLIMKACNSYYSKYDKSFWYADRYYNSILPVTIEKEITIFPILEEILIDSFDTDSIKTMSAEERMSFLNSRYMFIKRLCHAPGSHIFTLYPEYRDTILFGTKNPDDFEDREMKLLDLGWEPIDRNNALLSTMRYIENTMKNEDIFNVMTQRFMSYYYNHALPYIKSVLEKHSTSKSINKQIKVCIILNYARKVEFIIKALQEKKESPETKMLFLDFLYDISATIVFLGGLLRIKNAMEDGCIETKDIRMSHTRFSYILNSIPVLHTFLNDIDVAKIGEDNNDNKVYVESLLPENVKELFGADGAMYIAGDYYKRNVDQKANIRHVRNHYLEESFVYFSNVTELVASYIYSEVEIYNKFDKPKEKNTYTEEEKTLEEDPEIADEKTDLEDDQPIESIGESIDEKDEESSLESDEENLEYADGEEREAREEEKEYYNEETGESIDLVDEQHIEDEEETEEYLGDDERDVEEDSIESKEETEDKE
jgi:hypothetical protein